MYISQLVINGFKTFNSKTSLEFGDGITAVVGPNGCGKTNIVDAIRWVLGEQKQSTLRSARMEDVIFNGSKGTKPMSMCEVYLTVKNDKGKLPVDYTDVEIGRRIYRDGESEYFINRNVCRLKDINNLFVDTGMGADSYSVIELKMIEQILSESDEGRKFLFEEAAGINKYKNQRRLSLKKFEATKFDLERINDIISEVDAKVKGLNLQLKRFKRHATLVDKLRESEIDLSTLQINRYFDLSSPLRKKIKEYSHLREEKVSDQDIQESELNRLKETYSTREKEIRDIREIISNLNSNREDSRQKVLIWQEQNKSAEKDTERLNSETESSNSRIEKFDNNIKEVDKELESILPVIDDKLSIFKSEQSKFEDLENIYKTDQKSVDDIQSERWDLQKEITNNKSGLIRTESKISERGLQREKLDSRVNSENELIEQLKKSESEFESKIDSFSKTISQLNEEKSESENQLKNINEKITDLTTKKNSDDVLLNSLTNQSQFYQELVESQSDLPSGLKYVLDNKISSSNIVDTVSNLFSTNDKYEKAISTALGEHANCLICDDRNTAIEIITNINEKKAGKISIIPFDKIKNNKIDLPRIPYSEHVIDRASKLIIVDSKYSGIAELLLGNVLIVNDVKTAITDDSLINFTLVDLKGVSYQNLILRNPSSVKGTAIGRKDKIKSLNDQIEEIKKSISETENKVLDLKDQKESKNTSIVELSKQVDFEQKNIENSKSDFQKIKFDIESKSHIISESKKELKEIDDSVKELQKSLQFIQGTINKSEKVISSIQHRLDDANEKLDVSRKERDDHHQAMQDIRIDLLNLENKRDNLNSQKKTSENTIIEIQDRQNKIVNEINIIKEQSKDRTGHISEKENELIKINNKLDENQNNLKTREELFRDTYKSIEEIENRIKSEQQSRESILEELKQCEVSIAEYNQQIKSIKERILDKYDVKAPHTNEIENTEENLVQEIGRLERSIETIGPVNMAVQIEFEEEQRRLEHLIAQRDDLIESEENLRDSIEKIDRVARKQFRETFDHIKANFENLFTIFFEGGQGSLELIGDPDPLEADITIKAQPPGKRNQTLRMLSAGEKSLTAIALLFAIYQYKPSPYCILDEVDAPLDDTNVRKFTRGLKSFTTDTQFIIVTHNKLTMEAANYLYGVTMEKKGISKLVSVKFD